MSSRARPAGVLLVCLLGLGLSSSPPSSRAEDRKAGGNDRPPEAPPASPVSEPLTLPSDRLARKKIETALDYIKEQQWPEAVRLLQAVLDAKEDTFLRQEAKGPRGQPAVRFTSARAEAERLVGSLPAARMEYYQLHAGR